MSFYQGIFIFSDKDPDRTLKIQLSMEEARLKLQQKVSADAEKKREVEAKVPDHFYFMVIKGIIKPKESINYVNSYNAIN